jgi:hypothetical protein
MTRFGLTVFLTIFVFGPAYADNMESSFASYSETYCTPDGVSRTVATVIRGGYEDYEYAARCTGTTAQNLRAYVYATGQTASETGFGVEDVIESIAKFYCKWYSDEPATEVLLKGFGVQTRDAATGEPRDFLTLMREFDATLKKRFPD